MKNKLIEITTKLQEVVTLISAKLIEAAPKVYEMLLMIKIIESIQYLFIGVVAGIIAYLAITYTRRYFQDVATHNEGKDYYCHKHPEHLFWLIPLLMVTVTLTLTNLLNVWNYVGLIKPELAIAHDFIEAITAPTRNK